MFDQLIAHPSAHEEMEPIYWGVTNDCVEEGRFHLFIDCDEAKLEDVVWSCESIAHLVSDMYILLTSPWHFSVVAFSKHKWMDYLEIMGSFLARTLAYEYMCWSKGFSVLRLSEKKGVLPRAVHRIPGKKPECQKCKEQFLQFTEGI